MSAFFECNEASWLFVLCRKILSYDTGILKLQVLSMINVAIIRSVCGSFALHLGSSTLFFTPMLKGKEYVCLSEGIIV